MHRGQPTRRLGGPASPAPDEWQYGAAPASRGAVGRRAVHLPAPRCRSRRWLRGRDEAVLSGPRRRLPARRRCLLQLPAHAHDLRGRGGGDPLAAAEETAVSLRRVALALAGLVRRRRTRPGLSVSIITRDSEGRLASAVSRARHFAEEIVVGVDAASSDQTWEAACDLADVAYRFRHAGQLAPAHMLPFRYCKGQWILRLDDDEAMEEGFEGIAAQVMADGRLTHCWLARKWVVSVDPPRYLHAAPWYPDYQLRLMRNDASLVFKPPRYHSGYSVAGPGVRDPRCAILHFEPVLCSDEARERKRRAYLAGGGSLAGDRFFSERNGQTRPFHSPREAQWPRRRERRIVPEVHDLTARALPPWGFVLDRVDLPDSATVGQELPVVLHLRNTGGMSWVPFNGGRWPMLQVGFRLEASD